MDSGLEIHGQIHGKMAPTTRERIAEGFPGQRLTVLPPEVLRRAENLPICADYRVSHLGRFDRVRDHYVRRDHGSEQHILIVCVAGRGVVRFGGRHWAVRQGNGILIPAGTPHEYFASGLDPWTLFWFHFLGRQAAGCGSALGLEAGRPSFFVPQTEWLVEAFEECHQYALGGYTDADLIGLSTSFLRLIGLCRNLQRSPNLRQREREDRIVHCVRSMRENLHRKLSLKDLARTAGYSVPHFCMLFKRQVNCGPIEFFCRLRIQRACGALLRTELTVSEIAAQLGYGDPLYFSRLFRRRTGYAPTEYRRRLGLQLSKQSRPGRRVHRGDRNDRG